MCSMYNKGVYLTKVNTLLSTLVFSVKNKNALSLTDDSVLSEDFFAKLLNFVHGYNLVNLNEEEKLNYPGIDLGDKSARVCFQVTAQNSAGKIQETITKFEDNKGYERYDDMFVFVVGYKTKHNKEFFTKSITFDKVENIWDIRDLLRSIEALSTEKVAELLKVLEVELEDIASINPVELSESDISLLINTLWEYLGGDSDGSDTGRKYKIESREEDYIIRKNTLNQVEDTLFNFEIQPNLGYASLIEAFLGDPINAEQQKKYFKISDSLQKIYNQNQEQFDGIGSLFGFVFDEVINYERRGEVDDGKLLILLHNMYFNCDIGENPS